MSARAGSASGAAGTVVPREVEPPMAKQQYPIIERHSDGVIVTARSSVEAQQAASDALGTDCTITSVEKVHEGGIGGFFATELVRVTAKPSRFRSVDSELRAGLSSAEDLLTSMREQVAPVRRSADQRAASIRGTRRRRTDDLPTATVQAATA